MKNYPTISDRISQMEFSNRFNINLEMLKLRYVTKFSHCLSALILMFM